MESRYLEYYNVNCSNTEEYFQKAKKLVKDKNYNEYCLCVIQCANYGHKETIHLFTNYLSFNTILDLMEFDEELTNFFIHTAQNGLSYSICFLGSMYFDGIGIEQNYQKAVCHYKKSIKKNNCCAMFALSRFYLYTSKKYELAKFYIDMSIRNGNNRANLMLASYYEENHPKRDYVRAINIYNSEIKKGNLRALCYLANLYYSDNVKCYDKSIKQCNEILKLDESKFEELFLPEVNFVKSVAMNLLGIMYGHGYGISTDYEKQIEYYNLSVNLGNECAANNLAYAYNKNSSHQNIEKAYELYKFAVKKGNMSAANSLAIMCMDKKEYSEGIRLYKIATRMGSTYACYNLGLKYEFGEGVQKNYLKAMELYRKAARNNQINAIHKLGNIYSNGVYVKKNINKSLKYYQKAVELGDLSLIHDMVGILINDTKNTVNFKKMFELLQYGVKKNHAYSAFCLGMMYSNGMYVKQNYELSFKFYKIGSELGHDASTVQLGLLYYNGTGVEKNKEECYKLYNKALDNGYLDAMACLAEVYFIDGMNEKAIELCEKGVKEGISACAMMLANKTNKDENEKIELLNQAVELGNTFAIRELGLIYLNKNDEQKAIEFFEKCKNEDCDAKYELAQLYLKHNKKPQAMILLKNCVAQSHRSSVDMLANEYINNKEFIKAAQMYSNHHMGRKLEDIIPKILKLKGTKDNELVIKMFNKANFSAYYPYQTPFISSVFKKIADKKLAIVKKELDSIQLNMKYRPGSEGSREAQVEFIKKL